MNGQGFPEGTTTAMHACNIHTHTPETRWPYMTCTFSFDNFTTPFSFLMQHHDLFHRLPYDILTTIFDHLARNDILECMLVSRSWSTHVIQYAKTAFTHITFYADNKDNTNQYHGLLSRIGHHVQSVVVDQCPDAITLLNIVNVLASYECKDLTSLGM